MKETEIAAPVVQWLTDQGWEVFQEVDRGNVADIVGRFRTVRGTDLIWVIETKTSLSLKVLDQAIAWTPWAHFVSVAVPESRRTGRMSNRATNLVLRHYGLGLVLVGNVWERCHDWWVEEKLAPALHRVNPIRYRPWDEVLCEEQKTYCPAGSADAGHWTPFKGTCRRLRTYVEQNPGCPMKEAVEGIRHHYATRASAVSCLRSLVDDGVVPGVRLERDGRKVRLWPGESP